MNEDARFPQDAGKPWFSPSRPGDAEIAVIRDWWKALDGEKGDRARLRRVDGVDAVAFVPFFHRLRVSLERICCFDRDGLAVMAACLACVRENRPGVPLPPALSEVLSPLRFRRLLHADAPDEVLLLLRRGLAMLDGAADVREVATWAYALGNTALRDRAKRDFAFAYYGARIGRDTEADTTAEAADNA